MNRFNPIGYIRKALRLALFVIPFLGNAQEVPVPDELLQHEYTTLDSLYYNEEYTEKGKQYINAYLKKAKAEDDTYENIKAYHLFADFYDNDYARATTYIDSAIALVQQKKFKNHRYPAILFGKKAFIERIAGNFQNAINYYLKEMQLLDTIKNRLNGRFIKYNIGLIKRDYGDLEGAEAIFKGHLRFDEKRLKINLNEPEGYLESYLTTLHELVVTYRLLKKIDSAKVLNIQGLEIGKDNELTYLLKLNEGIFAYIDGDYEKSITTIQSVLGKLEERDNRYNYEIYNLIDAYFYIAESYKALSNHTQKLAYYQKIAALIETSNYLTPVIRTTYLELVAHYKEAKDNEKQLAYLNKFLYADSILDTNYKYINDRLETDYDIPNLIKEKETLIKSLTDENVKINKTQIIISVLLIVSLLGLGIFYNKQQRYKKRFKALFAQSNSKTPIKVPPTPVKEATLDISETTIAQIKEALEQFEQKEKYLKANLTLDKLAKSFKTNSKYLSFVLNKTKNKRISQYINDLRVDYVIEKLKQDTTFRKFTIKAIANEIGFNTDQAFSKAFFKKTGIYPSYFIKELEKNDQFILIET